jgi:DNA-binding winged helix-turn-helix (wHTH) protein/WD40 repeat protein
MPATESSPSAVERAPLARLSFGPFTFDTRSRLLNREGQEVALPPRVIGVLELLLDRAGDVVSRQELIDSIWKDAFVTDTSLAEAVSVLRQALGDDPQAPTYIQTLHRRGYRFVGPVSSATPAARVVASAAGSGDVIVSPSIGGQLVPWSAAVICALIAAVAVWQLTRVRQPVATAAPRFAVTTSPGTVFDAQAPALAFSPDGQQLAWSACDGSDCRLFVRPLDRLDAAPVAGTEDAHAPFFSPDGQWLGFFADGRVKKVALAGGAPVALADAPEVLGATWIGNDIIFAGSSSGGLMRVSSDGSGAAPLTSPHERDGEVRHAWPAVVPGTRVVLFIIASHPSTDAPGKVGAFAFDPRSTSEVTSWRQLASSATSVAAPAGDAIVSGRGSELAAVTFDATRIELTGAPRSILDGIGTAQGRPQVAVAHNRSIAWAVAPQPSASTPPGGLVWLTTAGLQGLPDEIRNLREAVLSPDGSRVAGVSLDGGRSDIWVDDVRQGGATRLTHGGSNASPVWSADGQTVYFAARSDGVYEIWKRDADGMQPATRVFADGAEGHSLPLAASPDASTLAFLRTSPTQHADIWLLPLTGGPARPLITSPFDDTRAAFSPDSKMLAVQSAESGRWGIYVVRLIDNRRVVISTSGAEHPQWTRAGLYFQSRGALMHARISDVETLRVEDVTGEVSLQSGTLRGVAQDGRLLLQRDSAPASTTAVVSLDWLREVRTLLGPPSTSLPR